MPFLDPSELDQMRELLGQRLAAEGADLQSPEKLESGLLSFVEELYDQADQTNKDVMMAYIQSELGV
jgi:hypothetical protein